MESITLGFILHLSQAIFDKLIGHAQECQPSESVALLFGHVKNSDVIVKHFDLVDNVLKSKTKFEVDPVEQYRLFIEAENRDEDLIGIFHSHPAPPVPSHTDIRNMKLNPVVWLIASSITGSWETNAFVLQNDEPIEIEMLIK
jgi:proteasome lid subunit RPN8/RPN11